MRRAIAVTVAVVALVAACGGDDSDDAAPTPSTTAASPGGERADLATQDDLGRRYGPALRAMGLEISRGGRVPEAGSRDYSIDGPHLAIYVRPTTAPTDGASYLGRSAELARIFLPDAFDVTDVESIDVCQEAPSVGGEEAPAGTETVLVATRAQSAKIPWDDVDVADLVRLAKQRPRALTFVVSEEIAASAVWQELRAAASSAPAGDG